MYMDFFLLKFESLLIRRSQILRKQLLATRVQYSNIGIQVDFDNKKEKISINIYAIMDRIRYKKKNYIQKLSDCNQVRNLVFYQKHGYKISEASDKILRKYYEFLILTRIFKLN